jgi:class 3 adenylate cyclase
VRLWSLVDPDSDGPVRVGRLLGFATRRMAEGLLDAWDDIARPDARSQGAPTVGERGRPADPTDPEQNLSFDMANIARKLAAFSFERQLEGALNARMVAAVERVLGAAGRLPPRQPRPPAIAFVDLSGFTTLTHEQGDEAAAQMATQLLVLAESAVRPEGGRIVKQLGDGALLRFADRQRALRAVLQLLTAIERAGLPAAHAGIAAGPIVVRDGDVFGRTVNLAARLAAAAPPREIFVEEAVVVALPGGTASFDAVGRIELPGLAEPVAVWRVRQPAGIGST